MATKNVPEVAFLDDTTASLLDNLYQLAKQYCKNEKDAENLIENITVVVIKLNTLHQNGQLSSEERKLAKKCKAKLRVAAMTMTSFYEIQYTYDRIYLVSTLEKTRNSLVGMVTDHFTNESMALADSVFSFVTNAQFLDAIFSPNSKYRARLGRVVADFSKAMEKRIF